jgi:hypothetical protein
MRQTVMASIIAAWCPDAYAALRKFGRSESAKAAARVGVGSPYEFFRVLYDDTSPEGRSFGAEAARRGAAARPVGADLGGVWLHEIEPRWRNGPAAIAGLTTGPHLFCLELLARDYGVGSVYRMRHARPANPHWVSAAVDLAMTCSVAERPRACVDLVDLASDSRVAEAPLYSWVIAPADGLPRLVEPQSFLQSLQSNPKDSFVVTHRPTSQISGA